MLQSSPRQLHVVSLSAANIFLLAKGEFRKPLFLQGNMTICKYASIISHLIWDALSCCNFRSAPSIHPSISDSPSWMYLPLHGVQFPVIRTVLANWTELHVWIWWFSPREFSSGILQSWKCQGLLRQWYGIVTEKGNYQKQNKQRQVWIQHCLLSCSASFLQLTFPPITLLVGHDGKCTIWPGRFPIV